MRPETCKENDWYKMKLKKKINKIEKKMNDTEWDWNENQ